MTGNIMIVDDSSVERKIVGYAIRKRFDDINIFEAENGLDISRKLLSNKIHVCILDILMPGKNGFEILEEIKADANVMDIPVIVCTSLSDKEAIDKALSLGAYDYFRKPLGEECMKVSLPLKVKNAINLMRRKEEIIYLSYHDKLTGLYNRRYSEEEMNRLDVERNIPFSLVMGDVNGLKLTNDAFGHEAGDKLLVRISELIKRELRKDEIAARIGGDEFLILLPKTSDEGAERIIQRIKEACHMEKEDPIKPSISFGYAVKLSPEQDIMNIYKEAEDKMYNNKLMEGKYVRNSIITTLIKILNHRFKEASAHSDRLKKLCEAMGKKLAFTPEQIHNLKLLALIHDIGITALPEEVIESKHEITSKESSIYKSHSEIGYRIANSFPDLMAISKDVLSHHERWDGSGYPQGIRGEDIPINARILSILDKYDSLVNGENKMSKEEAQEFILKFSGKYFDPELVKVFLKLEKG